MSVKDDNDEVLKNRKARQRFSRDGRDVVDRREVDGTKELPFLAVWTN